MVVGCSDIVAPHNYCEVRLILEVMCIFQDDFHPGLEVKSSSQTSGCSSRSNIDVYSHLHYVGWPISLSD